MQQPSKNLPRLRRLTTEQSPPIRQHALDRRGEVVGCEHRRRRSERGELGLGAGPLDLEALNLRDEGRDRPAVPHRFHEPRELGAEARDGRLRGLHLVAALWRGGHERGMRLLD